MTLQVPKYDDVSILVVGDVMLDRYWFGDASRISPEAPVPIVVVDTQNIDERPGGAGNVALNLRSLGCQVTLIGLIGNDSAGAALEGQLNLAGIDCYLERVPDRPTITKLRVLGRNQQLLRLDIEQKFHQISQEILLKHYQKLIADVDVVIFSDYGKGTLIAVEEMIRIAQNLGKPIFVDPKTKDFALYQGASVITPNQKEFEAVVGACQDEVDIVTRAQLLISQYHLTALLVTRGGEGMSLLQRGAAPLHLSAHNSEVYDVSGAGDTVISVLAASVAAGQDLNTAAVLANMAAGIVVRKLGASTVTISELRRALQRHHGSDLGILSENDLIVAVADARIHNEKIVMTNGCFDLLHAGHIAYLEEAKSLGDRLIVAVNSDDSVQRLKGSDRPMTSLQNRMVLLSALRFVDWVVAFTEDTPERLISQVLPDVLVKGGDYSVAEIAGGKQVLANGGKVKVLRFVEGYSTSSMIQRIKGEEICM
jgi:D-beta-D-heptose 7-phosphate kinase/D-beta-D-heptose 1-phosphate adenosyltransferase